MLPLVRGHERTPRVALVVGAGADQAVVVVLLEQVRGPARDAGGGDDRSEEIHRDADRVEERRRVEVDIGDEPLGRVDLRVQRHRQVVPEGLAGLTTGLLRHALQDGGARVARGVDAVTEAHQPALLGPPPGHRRAPGPGPTTASTLSSRATSSGVRITASPAPPCSVPFSAPTPPATAECMSESVAAITRVVKVEAFSSCSA